MFGVNNQQTADECLSCTDLMVRGIPVCHIYQGMPISECNFFTASTHLLSALLILHTKQTQKSEHCVHCQDWT